MSTYNRVTKPNSVRRPTFKKTVVFGFDNIFHNYSGEWKGEAVIEGEALPGAIEFLKNALKKFKVNIISPRSHSIEGREAMKNWFFKYLNEDLVEHIFFPEHVPPAWVVMDYRTFQFEGEYPSIEELENFEPASFKFQNKCRQNTALNLAKKKMQETKKAAELAEKEYNALIKKTK